MNILGLHCGVHDGSACIVKDGRLVVAISSERITRNKKRGGVTKEVIEYVLDEADITLDDVDVIALSNYSFNTTGDVLELFDGHNKIEELDDEVHYPSDLYFDAKILGIDKKAIVINHHLAHSASAYYTSNFTNAVCFSLDSSGFISRYNSSICIGDGKKLFYKKHTDLMIGSVYSVFTRALGFGEPVFKAGSLMGMAAYGEPSEKLIKRIKLYIHESKAEGFENHIQNTIKFIDNWSNENITSNLTNEYILTGKTNDKNVDSLSKLNSKNIMNLSASIQYLFEKAIMDKIEKEIILYGEKNICLSGGSFLNCNVNSIIYNSQVFDNIHLFPACGDDGISVGAALYVAHHIYDEDRYDYQNNEISYLGRNQNYIEPDYKFIAEQIANNKVIAWFMGRSEFGPRALGNRSILADPRVAHNRDILNFTVKNREWFRPFAPSVLEEKAHEWFSGPMPSPFMLYTQKVLQPNRVPAITHVDGSARIQTVNKNDNLPFYSLIKEFDNLTGVPLILNTSLNGNGTPILETEDDAIDLFESNKNIDILVLNGTIVHR